MIQRIEAHQSHRQVGFPSLHERLAMLMIVLGDQVTAEILRAAEEHAELHGIPKPNLVPPEVPARY